MRRKSPLSNLEIGLRWNRFERIFEKLFKQSQKTNPLSSLSLVPRKYPREDATCVSVSANRDASARSLLPEGTRLLSFSKQPAEQARAEERTSEREREREREEALERKFSLREAVHGHHVSPIGKHREEAYWQVVSEVSRTNEGREDGTL